MNLIGLEDKKQSAMAALKNRLPVLLYGFNGNGKTILAREIAEEYAKEKDIPVIYLQLYPEMTKNSLIGGETLENGSIVVKEQPVVTFGSKGAVFIVDECTHTTEPVLLAFNSLIEAPFSTVVGHKIVSMHEDTRFIFCGNVPDHTGNIPLPTSFANRLFIIKMDLLKEDELVSLGQQINKDIPFSILKFVSKVITDTHDSSFPISPRNLVTFCLNYPSIKGTGFTAGNLPSNLRGDCKSEDICPKALKNSIMSSLMSHAVFKTDGPQRVEALLWD